MMINLYSVFDVKLGQYNTPMAFQSRGVAIRSFMDEVKREDSGNMLNKHPEDFMLFFVGCFDAEAGVFGDASSPEFLIRGSDAVS